MIDSVKGKFGVCAKCYTISNLKLPVNVLFYVGAIISSSYHLGDL